MSNKEENSTVLRFYNCPYCEKTHNITLPLKILDGKPHQIVPYVFLHSSTANLNDLLTILYLDGDFHIRSVEVVKVENSNIFSEDLTRKISEKLMDVITNLEQENLELRNLLSKVNILELSQANMDNDIEKIKIYLLSIIGFGEKRADLLIPITKNVGSVKERASEIFGLKVNEFHLSFGGIILKENYLLKDYEIENGDEIVLIPASISQN